jgi:hypothetical protein
VLAVGEGLSHETLGFSAGASGENGGSKKLHFFIVLKSTSPIITRYAFLGL